MIESTWNNIQIDWLQSPNKNNNFQTYRTVRVSLTVKKMWYDMGLLVSSLCQLYSFIPLQSTSSQLMSYVQLYSSLNVIEHCERWMEQNENVTMVIYGSDK